jgi:hypothetical protein
MIYNPEGLLFQRTAPETPTNIANDNFGPDRWNVLCSANNVAISRSTDAPAGSRHSMQLAKATASGFFGIHQMFEASESIPLQNQYVTFSVWVKTQSSQVSQARISVLGWTGTADSITSSIVSSWASTPTYIANVTEYAAQTVSLTSSWQQVQVTALVNGACNNLMVLVHTTNSQLSGDTMFVSQAQLINSSDSQPYVRVEDEVEVSRCQRYYEKTYDLDTAPGTATTTGSFHSSISITASGQPVVLWFKYSVQKRATASGTLYNSTTGASGTWNDNGGATIGFVLGFGSQSGVRISTPNAVTNGRVFSGHVVADAEL